MQEKTLDLIKKIEHDYKISVGATDARTYWIIHARVPKKQETGFYCLYTRRKYITAPNQEGSVLILPHPRISDAYLIESWGEMETFDDFVRKALSQIIVDTNVADNEEAEGYGTGCV